MATFDGNDTTSNDTNEIENPEAKNICEDKDSPAQTSKSSIQSPVSATKHYSSGQISLAACEDAMVKQGYDVTRITASSGLNIPVQPLHSDTHDVRPPIFIPKGQEILIIKTATGIFLRTIDGRFVSISLKNSPFANLFKPEGLQSRSLLKNSNTSFTFPSNSNLSIPSTSSSNSIPEIIDLSDDEGPSSNQKIKKKKNLNQCSAIDRLGG